MAFDNYPLAAFDLHEEFCQLILGFRDADGHVGSIAILWLFYWHDLAAGKI